MQKELNLSYNLSKCERIVWKLTALGLSSKEIADKLNRSTFTIQRHLANIKIKLGVQKMSEIVGYYYCSLMNVDFKKFRDNILQNTMTIILVIGMAYNISNTNIQRARNLRSRTCNIQTIQYRRKTA